MLTKNSLSKYIFLTLIACLTLQLTGCGGHRRYKLKKDCAPKNRHINFAKIPNAVPRNESKSRYGNRSPYKVLGRWYRVLPNARGYKQRGMISWYGAKFHGHLTSDRERYNLYGMTAASKILPLPTYVLVTNLRNGRKVILRVNDRGPFVSTRIMDVSYAAAKKLGFIGTGTTYAEVTAIDPNTWHRKRNYAYKNRRKKMHPSPKGSLPPVITGASLHPQASVAKQFHPSPLIPYPLPPTSDIYLQVGAFADLNNAKNLANRVTSLTHIPANINPVDINHKQIYRVSIGPIANESEKEKIKKLLRV